MKGYNQCSSNFSHLFCKVRLELSEIRDGAWRGGGFQMRRRGSATKVVFSRKVYCTNAYILQDVGTKTGV